MSDKKLESIRGLKTTKAAPSINRADLIKRKVVQREKVLQPADNKPVDIKFERGEEPTGKFTPIEGMPMVMRFPPSSYRPVKPDEFDTWKKELEERLGGSFDIGPGIGGTISFCKRGGSGAAYRCDSDMESSSAPVRPAVPEKPEDGHLTPWPATPVVLDFPPMGFEQVESASLKDWKADIEARLGRSFDIGPGLGGTVTFCPTPGSGYGYRCDCDA